MIVEFDALVEALEGLGWAAKKESTVLWKFFKQEIPTFKEIAVHQDGTVRLTATMRGKPLPYRLVRTDWETLNVIQDYVKEVLE